MQLSKKQKKAVERLKGISPDIDFFGDVQTKNPKFIKGTLSKPSAEDAETIARKFLDENRNLLDMPEGLEEKLEVSLKETDKQGFNHILFQQNLNGIPVFEGSTQVHINAKGEVVAYKDYRVARVDIPLDPSITKDSAIETALKDVDTEEGNIESDARLTLYRDSGKELHLALEVELHVGDEPGGRFYFIDAHTGEILYKFAEIRGVMSRRTYTANNQEWVPGELVIQDDQVSSDEVVQSAHDHAKIIYEYYKKTFERDSYDNHGAQIISTVHFKQNYNNAYWSDWYNQMFYGDGDGVNFKPLVFALDIMGHEFTHAVTSETAKFVYAEEAGALDEFFADFFGVMITNDDPITNWEMGEGVYTPYVSGDALRDLSDPPKYGLPDHMDDYRYLSPGELPDRDKNDYGWVHFNNGIPSKAAYLIIEGGTHHGVTVEGIGREKAENIHYLALTGYLSSSTRSRWTFNEARYALLNACRELLGDTGPEYAAIKNAWSAVGIGEPNDDFVIIEKEVSPNISIPDNDTEGVQSALAILEQGLLKDISVNVTITHTYIGDLRVTLISPTGEIVVLHDRIGGPANDIVKTFDLQTTPALAAFIDDPVNGDWVLQVSDHAQQDEGELVQWGIALITQKVITQTLKEEVVPNIQIPNNDPVGIESLINIEKSGKIVNLDVSVDITHSWIGDLRVILVSPSGDETVLHNRTGYSRHDIKKTYRTKVDQSMRVFLGTELAGEWRLKILDLAAEDIGILNSWSIEATYE